MPHGETELSDPVEELLKKTGCIELHYKVQVVKKTNWFCAKFIDFVLSVLRNV